MKKIILIIFSVILLCSIYVLSYADFRKGPYLQNVKQDSITICWQTDVATTGTVHYGPDGIDLSVTDNTVSSFHEVTLTGLTTGTSYRYYVVAGADTSTTTSFSTAVSTSSPFRFIAYGDNRPDPATNDTSAHQDVVDLIRSLSPKFVVNVGDMYTTNNSSDVDLFFDVEQELIKRVTLFPARGNHENNIVAQPDRFGQYFSLPTNLNADDANAYYSLNYGNSHFLFINTEIDYTVGSVQYTAIHDDLDAADADPDIKHIFVVMHRAAHSNGSHHGGAENPNLSVVLGPLFLEHSVDIVFQGHDHHYERFQPEGSDGSLGDPPGNPDFISEGVTYVVTGGGGAPLSDVPNAPFTEPVGVTPRLTSQVAKTTYQAMQIYVSGVEAHVTVYCANETLYGEECDGLNENGSPSGVFLDEFTINKSPLVNFLDVTPRKLYLGNIFNIAYTIRGNRALKEVQLWRATDTNKDGKPDWPSTPIATATLSGQKSYSGSFIDKPTSANTYWYGIRVFDTKGNWNDEENSNTKGVPGVYGPINVTVTNPPSCPSLYSWDGNTYVPRGPVFPGAFFQEKEYIDHIPLDQLVPHDGKYYFQIRETELERSFIDTAYLIVIDSSSTENNDENVFPNRDSMSGSQSCEFAGGALDEKYAGSGGSIIRKVELYPSSAIHSVLRRYVRRELLYADDKYVRMDIGDVITLTFPYLPEVGTTREFIFVIKGFYVPTEE